jgi:hypothetical protein
MVQIHMFKIHIYKITKYKILLKISYTRVHSPDIIRQVKSRRMRWAGHVARMGEEREMYKVLVGKPEGKRPLVRPRRRWENGIRMILGRLAWGVCVGFECLRTGTGGGLL